MEANPLDDPRWFRLWVLRMVGEGLVDMVWTWLQDGSSPPSTALGMWSYPVVRWYRADRISENQAPNLDRMRERLAVDLPGVLCDLLPTLRELSAVEDTTEACREALGRAFAEVGHPVVSPSPVRARAFVRNLRMALPRVEALAARRA